MHFEGGVITFHLLTKALKLTKIAWHKSAHISGLDAVNMKIKRFL